METKRQATVKFFIGVVLIVISLILGKLALVPIIIFPSSSTWRTWMITLYAFSWMLILVGIYLAGLEGFRLATHKYKEYQRRTVYTVKQHGITAARKTKNAAHKTKRAAKKTVRVLKNPRKAMRERPRAR